MSGGSSPKHETAPVALCERRGGPAAYRRLDNLSHFLDCRPHDRLSSFIDQRQEYTGILPLEGSAGRIIGFWPVLHRKSASCRRRHSTTRVETGHLFLLPFRLRPSVEVDGCSGQRIVFRPIIVLCVRNICWNHKHHGPAQSSVQEARRTFRLPSRTLAGPSIDCSRRAPREFRDHTVGR